MSDADDDGSVVTISRIDQNAAMLVVEIDHKAIRATGRSDRKHIFGTQTKESVTARPYAGIIYDHGPVTAGRPRSSTTSRRAKVPRVKR